MTDDWHEKQTMDKLQTYKGVPSEFEDYAERSRWRRFLKGIAKFAPWFIHKHNLSEQYLEAKVAQEHAKAEKIAAETAEIVARREHQEIQNLKKLCDILDENIFGVDGASSIELKLAQLRKVSPQIAEQIQLIESKVILLKAKGAKFEFDEQYEDTELLRLLRGKADQTNEEEA